MNSVLNAVAQCHWGRQVRPDKDRWGAVLPILCESPVWTIPLCAVYEVVMLNFLLDVFCML